MTKEERLALKPGQLVLHKKRVHIVIDAAWTSIPWANPSPNLSFINGPYTDWLNPPTRAREIDPLHKAPRRRWLFVPEIDDWKKAKRIA